MRKLTMASLWLPALVIATVTTAAAVVSPTTGQPGAPTNTCGPANPVTPGGSAGVPGSVFNPNGQAGAVYAGNPGTASSTPPTARSRSPSTTPHASGSAIRQVPDPACQQAGAMRLSSLAARPGDRS
jgi:hypothetical protein